MAAYPRWLALALGVIAATGFQPLALWPLTLLAFAGLIALIARAETWRRAAMIGWLFGIGHFTLGNIWIATAFTYQAEMPAWIGWVAVVGLALYLAAYPALAALGGWLAARGGGAALTIGFAACWIVSEWLRSWVFTGYVWNPLGVVALGPFNRPGLAIAATMFGTYGLSAVLIILAGCWLGAFNRRRVDWQAGMLVAVPIMLMLQPGAIRMTEPVGRIPFTLVQPDVRQSDLDNPALYESQFIKTARLTLPTQRGQQRLVLWPESGIPDYLREGYPRYLYQENTYAADPLLARQRIGGVIGPGSLLLVGTADIEMQQGEVVGARNVVTAIDDRGAIRGSYAKAHLVPGGEYLPLRAIMEPLGASRLVAGSLDFWPGPGPRTLDLGRFGKAGVQICYEIIFSGQVIDAAHRPDYIFNPSNDGWFGSWGPPQFLAQARLRAIEEGLPIIRATTTGISAVIDADGIVRQSIPRFTAARLDGYIPPAHPPTLFARLGNMLPLGWAFVLFVLTLVAMRRRQA